MREQSESALAGLADRIAAYRQAGFGTYLSSFLHLAAVAHVRAGKVEAGLELLTEAIERVQSAGERWCEAELYRARGELLATQRDRRRSRQPRDGMGEPESWLERALEVARDQGARLWEVRAAVNLARLRQAQGRTAEARGLLEPIERWSPLPPESPEVREASALLEHLG